ERRGTDEPPHFRKHRADASPRKPRLDHKAKILSPTQGGDERHGTDRAPGIDMEQNISPVVVPLDAHLEELKERSVLRDELVSESRRLGCGVGGGLASEEGDR
ncbi:MAG: hypothetical protein QOE55_5495, partial [Acidobacteriaceae bacterium]|nr:hypothetical protein [Acidobacteriaceae bacterium]